MSQQQTVPVHFYPLSCSFLVEKIFYCCLSNAQNNQILERSDYSLQVSGTAPYMIYVFALHKKVPCLDTI